MSERTPAEANRRYHRAFWPTMAAYAALCFAAPLAIRAWSLDGPVLYLAAFSPAVPIAIVLLLMGRWLQEVDEYIRARQVEAMLIGWAVTAIFTTGWGFLEMNADVPRFPLAMVLPMFFAVYGLAFSIRTLRGAR